MGFNSGLKGLKYTIISQHNYLLSIMLIAATCFDSTESSSGYLRTVFKVHEVAVHILYTKGLQQQVLY
jgi:hypothetical protein